MTPSRDPTPEMITAGIRVIESLIDRRIPERLMADAWRAMWDTAMSKPTWRPMWTSVEAFGRGDPPDRFERLDGASVRWTKTKTGKRPWQGSRWHRGEWKLNDGSFNSATAETAMAKINYHWPYPVKGAKP